MIAYVAGYKAISWHNRFDEEGGGMGGGMGGGEMMGGMGGGEMMGGWVSGYHQRGCDATATRIPWSRLNIFVLFVAYSPLQIRLRSGRPQNWRSQESVGDATWRYG